MGCGSGCEGFKQLTEAFAGAGLGALHLLQLQAIKAPHCRSFICWETDPAINHLVKICGIYTAMGINVRFVLLERGNLLLEAFSAFSSSVLNFFPFHFLVLLLVFDFSLCF